MKMGLKDTAAKNFFGRTEILADLLDYALYDGKAVVQAEQLTELCGEHYQIVQDETGKFRTDNRFRDKLFEYDTGKERLSVGLELQSRNDKYMVLRIMTYDARRLRLLFQQGRLSHIVNLVLSFDRSRRPCACNLEEIIQQENSLPKKCFYNYGFISLNIYELAEKTEMFSCKELKTVLNYFRRDQDSKQLMEALAEGRLEGRLSRDAALLCAIFLGLEIDVDNDAEEIDMCKAFRDFKRDCIKAGRKLGRDEGVRIGRDEGVKIGEARGKENTIREIVVRLLRLSYSILDICSITGASEETVREISLATQP